MSLKFSQLVQCKFVNELSSIIETISNKQKSTNNELCSIHKIAQLYYCAQCSEALCSDCFMFEKKHKDHEIKRLDVIYKAHLEKINKETEDLQGKFDIFHTFLLKIEEKIGKIKNHKNERINEIEGIYENLKKKYFFLIKYLD
jgi:hypothetical protein